MATTQKITTNLWFDNNAEAAVDFYTSVFKNSRIGRKTFYGKEGQEFHKKEPGTVMTIEFYIEEQEYVALNANNEFQFNESISFIVNCEGQDEVDYYWNKLSDGGQAQVCGWLKDKFGVSWQVVPKFLTDLLVNGTPEQISKASGKLFQMKKIDIQVIKDAINS